MPTYRALGITATLSVANLQASLSIVNDLRQGAEQRKDAERIVTVFENGRNLPERPIGADGSDKGVQQFIGNDEDLPFFVVEAGEGLRRSSELGSHEREREVALYPSGGLTSLERTDTDSPLTSLPDTPSGGTPAHVSSQIEPETPNPRVAHRHDHVTPAHGVNTPPPFAEFEKARSFLSQPTGPQALCLTVETCNKSFLPRPDSRTGRARTVGKDLKVEVFINGELSGTSFVNARGSAVEFSNNKVRFTGTRLHRQMEKPWAYEGDAAAHTSPTKRWHAIQSALRQEAACRGRNRLGDLPPSAELLTALSHMSLPERVSTKNNLGVVDLIITAGSGKKYGPSEGYVLAPTRMIDPDYSTHHAAADPFSEDVMLLDAAAEDASPLRGSFLPELHALTSSPEVPLARQRSAQPMPQTPTRKQRTEFDLDGVNLDIVLTGFETSRGKTGSCRTLKRRLTDIKMMNPQNREKATAALRAELGEDLMRAMNNEVMEDVAVQSPSKKARLESSFDFGLNILADAALAETTIDPMKVFRSAPAPLFLPDGAEPEAMLTQCRIDMALGAGLESNGALLRRIASTSPQRTPPKKTRASALANSPCTVPVKDQPSKVRKPATVQHSTPYYHPDGSPMELDPKLTATPPSIAKRSGRGANRNAKAWNPHEMTAQDVLKVWKVPELCEGSVVTYAKGNEERQIGKARNGEFKEETVVVGMRFLVV